MSATGVRRRSCSDVPNQREASTKSGVVFTHLFSAPLTSPPDTVLASSTRGNTSHVGGESEGGSKPVQELSYQGERETLVKTLSASGKKIKFMSEAANTESFARAVGCPSTSGCNTVVDGGTCAVTTPDITGAARGGTAVGVGRNCRDGQRRILHFTGHAEPGKLTFEDRHGQLQYVDEPSLLAMLQCREPGDGVADSNNNCNSSACPVPCTPSRGAALADRQRSPATVRSAPKTIQDNGFFDSYRPFEDTSASIMCEDEVDEHGMILEVGKEQSSAGGAGLCRAAEGTRSGLQLVFISSCHSASLANVFIQAVSLAST